MLPKYIYKIASFEEWDLAQSVGRYDGAAIDLADGYIHFSTADQVSETAAKHFANRDDLVLLKIDTEPMARHYKMEVSRGGALFPHLYAKLPISCIVAACELPMGDDGQHILPTDLFEAD